jgi:quercetin dioxygenase-like cupin family protein
MRVLPVQSVPLAAITRYDSASADSARIAAGHGEAHVHLISFAAGGVIGTHEAGFGQLFVVLEGTGWVAGEDGRRIALVPGELAFITRGERHSKGSEYGATALMIQVRDLDALEEHG